MQAIPEHTRQAYLEAMGIQTWYPRRAWPNARAARVLARRDEPALPVAKPASTPQRLTAAAILDSVQGAVAVGAGTADSAALAARPRETPAKPLTETFKETLEETLTESPRANPAKSLQGKPKESQETQPPKSRKKPGKSSAFRLLVIPVAPDQLVIAEMPHAGNTPFTRFHQRLLRDLLKSLDITLTGQEPVHEFSWPLHPGLSGQGLLGQIHQDDQVAAEALRAFLNNQFSFTQQRRVWLLGQAAARFVIAPEQPFEALRGIHNPRPGEPGLIVCHSLNELMKVPGLKAETWQDLKRSPDSL